MQTIKFEDLSPEYVVLGMIDAYMGYKTSFDNRLDFFYAHEENAKNIFVKLVERCNSFIKLSTYAPVRYKVEEVVKTQGDDNAVLGYNIYEPYFSPELIYRFFNAEKYIGLSLGKTFNLDITISFKDDFYDMTIEQSVSFLYGLFLRNGSIDNDRVVFKFANNGERIRILYLLLQKFDTVITRRKYEPSYPSCTTLTIESEELLTLFKKFNELI